MARCWPGDAMLKPDPWRFASRRIPRSVGRGEIGSLPMLLTGPASPLRTGEALGKAQGAFRVPAARVTKVGPPERAWTRFLWRRGPCRAAVW